jgi:hypothetical protein
MATYNYGIYYPFSASGDLSAAQYRFVTQAGTAKRVIRSTGACNPAPMGILQNDPRSGEEATVCVWGVSKVLADAETGTAIAYGDFLTSGSTGMAVANTNGSSVAAVALEALASGSGIYIECLVLPYASGNKADNVA